MEALERRVLAREVVEAFGFCSLSSSMSNLRFVVARAGSCGGGGEDAMADTRYAYCVWMCTCVVSYKARPLFTSNSSRLSADGRGPGAAGRSQGITASPSE